MDIFTGISLFSGVCGLELGIKRVIPNYRTICYVELDRYAQGVIQSRIRINELDDAPIWDDITTFDGRPWAGRVDIISGGFPCQDVSLLGKRRKLREGTRTGLWFEFERIIDVVRPRYAFIENVPDLFTGGFEHVLSGLARLRYDAIWSTFFACSVGAPHARERLYCLAFDPNRCDVNTVGEIRRGKASGAKALCKTEWPDLRSGVDGAVDGPPYRLDRFRRCGNGVVPQQAALALKILMDRIAGRETKQTKV